MTKILPLISALVLFGILVLISFKVFFFKRLEYSQLSATTKGGVDSYAVVSKANERLNYDSLVVVDFDEMHVKLGTIQISSDLAITVSRMQGDSAKYLVTFKCTDPGTGERISLNDLDANGVWDCKGNKANGRGYIWLDEAWQEVDHLSALNISDITASIAGESFIFVNGCWEKDARVR